MTPYYQDEAATIYLGDCREVLPQLGPVDHVITDPPYARDVYLRMRKVDSGAGRLQTERVSVGSGLRKMAAGEIGDMDTEIATALAGEFARLVRRWCLVFSDVEFCGEWREALQVAGMRYVRTGAWVKPDAMPQMTGDRPAVGFEPATIAHAKAGRLQWNGGGRPAVWHHPRCMVNRPDHPCPKPELLMRELVTLFTDPGETILDPFMGSGTTLVAAKRLGRLAIGIEREERFAEVAAKRLAQGALDLFGEAAGA